MGTPKNLTDSGRQKAWAANRAKAANNTNNNRAAMLITEYKKQGMALQAIADLLTTFLYVLTFFLINRFLKRQRLPVSVVFQNPP